MRSLNGAIIPMSHYNNNNQTNEEQYPMRQKRQYKEGPKVIALAALREPDQSLAIPLLISAASFSVMTFLFITLS